MSARSSAKKKQPILLAIVLAILIVSVLYSIYLLNNHAPVGSTTDKAPSVLSVLFIDVGQADSALISFETGETMLIDAGESSDKDAIIEELDERGIKDIDFLVATHPHSDHIGGMRSIIEHYHIGRMLMPDMMPQSKVYKELIEAVNQRNIPVDEACAGYSFLLGKANCTVVSPDGDTDKDANNESVAIFLDYNDTEFLFTGDMEEWAEDALLDAHYFIDADVIKVAHHGSSTGTSEAFIAAVTPDYAVISCGKGNKYGHPHSETLDLLDSIGAVIYRTDLAGDVQFISDGKMLEIKTGD